MKSLVFAYSNCLCRQGISLLSIVAWFSIYPTFRRGRKDKTADAAEFNTHIHTYTHRPIHTYTHIQADIDDN